MSQCAQALANKAAPAFEVPNCQDPVFRMWCRACGVRAGDRLDWSDARVAVLEQLMQTELGYADYDPLQDPLNDPFPEERLPY